MLGTPSYFGEEELPRPLTAASLPLPASSPLPHDITRETDGFEDANASDTPTDAATDVAHTVAGSERLEGLPEIVSWTSPPSTSSLPVQCSSRSRRPIRRKMAAARNRFGLTQQPMRDENLSPRRKDLRLQRHSVLPLALPRMKTRVAQSNTASYCGTLWQLPAYLAPEDNVIKWTWAIQKLTRLNARLRA